MLKFVCVCACARVSVCVCVCFFPQAPQYLLYKPLSRLGLDERSEEVFIYLLEKQTNIKGLVVTLQRLWRKVDRVQSA